jgi:hypothetical protein
MSMRAAYQDRYLCETCDKFTYRTRRDARQARKAYHRGDQGMQAYECPTGRGYHLGHISSKYVPPPNLNDPNWRPPPKESAADAARRIWTAGARDRST